MMPRMLQLGLYGLAAIPLVMGIAIPAARDIGVLLTVWIFVLSLVDLAISPRLSRIRVQREAGDVMSLGARNVVRVVFKNMNGSTVLLQMHDEPPQPSAAPELPLEVKLPPGTERYAVYHVQPHKRGKRQFGRLQIRMKSRLSLWILYDHRYFDQPVRIYPDIQAVHGVELLARQNRVAEAGVKLSRLRGRGSDFDRLREYRRGDEFRCIDWKATARNQKLISREYVVERNQNILFLLDCGRSMCNETDNITHFDRALNAVILLSYVALRQGDTVGVLACSNKVDRWVPPLRGAGAIRSLISQTYDIEPSYNASDYGLMVEELGRRYRRRSLVVFVTHALDEVHLQSIGKHARMLKSPHLVMLAFLRNVPLFERMTTVPKTDLEAFQVAAAAGMAATQTVHIAKLQQSGLLVVDSLPEQLSAQMISQYLDIKARHLL